MSFVLLMTYHSANKTTQWKHPAHKWLIHPRIATRRIHMPVDTHSSSTSQRISRQARRQPQRRKIEKRRGGAGTTSVSKHPRAKVVHHARKNACTRLPTIRLLSGVFQLFREYFCINLAPPRRDVRVRFFLPSELPFFGFFRGAAPFCLARVTNDTVFKANTR